MDDHPAITRPTQTFAQLRRDDQTRSEPTGSPVNTFRVALFNQGVQLGWLGRDGSDWARLVDDVQQSLVLEQYPHDGVTYYRIKGSSRYMSVSNNAYVGFYNWLGATGFTLQGGHLVSDHNHQKLSFQSASNGYLFAWDAYTVLDVQLQPLDQPIHGQPLGPGIEHVVVLMLENRSFDNMLGGLHVDLTREGLYRGLKGDESIPLDPTTPNSPAVRVFQGGNDGTNWIRPYPDPGELFDDMTQQLYGGVTPAPGVAPRMNGFAWNYGKQPGAPLHKDGPKVEADPGNVMQYYDQRTVPMTSWLGLQYAVCDSWFAAGPVQTLANRVFAHCGTPGLVPGTNSARIDNPDFVKGLSLDPPFEPPVKDKTIFELLDDTYPGEVNWKVYYHDAPISALCQHVYDHWHWLTWDTGNVYRFKEHANSQTNLEYDIVHGRLPKYSFIEPRYTDFFRDGPVNSAHPGGAGIDFGDPNGSSLPPPISVQDGEHLLSEVYGILAKYPDTFLKTLLVVIYDEHGGLYDHVAPPPAVPPFAGPVDNFNYDRNGVRIPALLINPAIPPGTVYPPRDAKTPPAHFDHTSLISTLCAQFGLTGPALSPRAAAARTLTGLIPASHVAHARPPAPVVQPSAPTLPVPPLAAEARLAAARVTWRPETQHGLAPALLPLLSISHRHRLASGN